MNRIAASRRAIVSSVSDTHIEAKSKRVPLARISNNPRVRGTGPERPSKPTPNEPAIPMEQTVPAPFSHREVRIGDNEDPQDVAEFEHIIYRSVRGQEGGARHLRFTQAEITLRDRSLLVDALDRFHYKLGLTTNALYRFIGILDRYLAVAPVPKPKLRVVGCAALLIASKIEDIYPAQSSDLIQLAEQQFAQSELFGTERQMLNAIQFDTTFATPLFYLTQFMRIHDQTKEALLLGRYILEIAQTHDAFFGVSASMTAAAATLVTRILNEEEKWPEELAGYTMYNEEELEPYVVAIREMLLEPDREESKFMRRKYSSEPFYSVAMVKIPAGWR